MNIEVDSGVLLVARLSVLIVMLSVELIPFAYVDEIKPDNNLVDSWYVMDASEYNVAFSVDLGTASDVVG